MQEWKKWVILALITLTISVVAAFVDRDAVTKAEMTEATDNITEMHNRDVDRLYEQNVRIEDKVDEVKDLLIER